MESFVRLDMVHPVKRHSLQYASDLSWRGSCANSHLSQSMKSIVHDLISEPLDFGLSLGTGGRCTSVLYPHSRHLNDYLPVFRSSSVVEEPGRFQNCAGGKIRLRRKLHGMPGDESASMRKRAVRRSHVASRLLDWPFQEDLMVSGVDHSSSRKGRGVGPASKGINGASVRAPTADFDAWLPNVEVAEELIADPQGYSLLMQEANREVERHGEQEEPSVRKSKRQKPLVLDAAVYQLPHPARASRGGEDANLVEGDWLGVADGGTTQWAEQGVNSGLYSQELMWSCVDVVRSDGDASGSEVRERRLPAPSRKGRGAGEGESTTSRRFRRECAAGAVKCSDGVVVPTDKDAARAGRGMGEFDLQATLQADLAAPHADRDGGECGPQAVLRADGGSSGAAAAEAGVSMLNGGPHEEVIVRAVLQTTEEGFRPDERQQSITEAEAAASPAPSCSSSTPPMSLLSASLPSLSTSPSSHPSASSPPSASPAVPRPTPVPLRSKSRSPREVLMEAHARTGLKGSCTATLATLQDNVLLVASIGDSGFVVVRQGEVVAHSEPQEHSFDRPFQIGCNCGDEPSCAAEYEVALQQGDVVLLATDGIFENLFRAEIAAVISGAQADGLPPEAAAKRLVQLAQKRSQCPDLETPFSEAAKAAGREQQAGKLDDITAVLAYVS